jgi:hypothetical protein
MAQFNLEDYETVEERLKRFWADERSLDARIQTYNHTTAQDRSSGTWIVEARIYLTGADQELDIPKATGWAFEIDGAGMANKTSALENCETSAIGRALANMNYSGNKRASREEMAKVQRGNQPTRDYLAEAQLIMNREDLRKLYNEARSEGIGQHILSQITDYGKALEKLEKGE